MVRLRRVVIRGFGSGAVAGLAHIALMYLAKLLIGTTPLPQLLQQPILAVMPGFVFGFLIDTLQHAGKVVEEAGLIVGMIVGLGVLGGAWGWARKVWARPPHALAFAAVGWAMVAFVLLPISGESEEAVPMKDRRRPWSGACSSPHTAFAAPPGICPFRCPCGRIAPQLQQRVVSELTG